MYNTLSRFSDLNVEGYGLGLSIVARIIQKLDGTVSAESTIGEGNTFSFTLPKA